MVSVLERAPKQKKRRIMMATSIRSLPVPKNGAVDYFDNETRGLSLRITSTGVRTWTFMYRNAQGKLRRLTLGRYDDRCGLKEARDLAADNRQLIREGKDPAQEKRVKRTAMLFPELAQRWMDEVGKHLKRGGAEEQRQLDADFGPWKHRPAAEITSKDARELLKPKLDAGFKVAFNRTRALISRIYNHGIANELVTSNPVFLAVKKQDEHGRQRVLTEDEIRRVWKAAGTQSKRVEAWFKLRLTTGQRGGEVMRMRWFDLDAQQEWWTLPGEFTKNGLDHVIYLNEISRKLLAEVPRRDDSVWPFPCGDRVKKNGEIEKGENAASVNLMGDYKKTARRLAQPSRANIVIGGHAPGKRAKAGFSGHDLRRTMTTILARGGVPRELAKKVLNHANEEKDDVTAIYDRYEYKGEKKAVLNFWGKQLEAILAGKHIKTVGRFKLEELEVE
jgi:Phage integrase family.